MSFLLQVKAVVEILLQNNKIRAATHNIMAYRIAQPEKGTFQQVGACPAFTACWSLLAALPVIIC